MHPSIPAILITFMYFVSGISKIFNFASVSAGFAAKVPVGSLLANLVIALVIILEIFAPVAIVLRTKLSRLASRLLAVFTVLATLLYHMPPTGDNYYHVLSNITAVGALLLLGGGALPLTP